jgi:colanic acid biosynthesis glycosyl transferase WcaI
MRILFLTENFPPERNAPASRVYERACYWVLQRRVGGPVADLECSAVILAGPARRAR